MRLAEVFLKPSKHAENNLKKTERERGKLKQGEELLLNWQVVVVASLQLLFTVDCIIRGSITF